MDLRQDVVDLTARLIETPSESRHERLLADEVAARRREDGVMCAAATPRLMQAYAVGR